MKKNGKIELPEYIKDNEKDNLYQIEEYLGKGGFAECYKVKDVKTNIFYAAKITPSYKLVKKHHIKRYKKEIKIHKTLDHPNIVKLFLAFSYTFYKSDIEINKDVNCDKICYKIFVMLMELCDTSLDKILKKEKRLSEIQSRKYVLQIIDGLEYIHSKNLIHLDIKPGNILIKFENNGQTPEIITIKICDFGLTKYVENDDNSICGTPNYISPEVLLNCKKSFNYKSDIWSLGVLLYVMVIGKQPFDAFNSNTIFKKIKKLLYYFPDKIFLSSVTKDLINKILVKNEKRIDLNQMKIHDFFTSDLFSTKKTKNIIDLVYEKIEKNDKKNDKNISVEKNENLEKNISVENPLDYWIINYYHDTNYGLFFKYNNGRYGVCFDDHTTMMTTFNNKIIYKNKKFKKMLSFDNKNYENEINKRIGLLKTYIDKNIENNKINKISPTYRLKNIKNTNRNVIRYVVVDNDNIFIRFNNNLQVMFKNKISIIFNEQNDKIVCANEQNEMIYFNIKNIPKHLDSYFNYIKDVLGSLINKRKNK